MTNPAPSRARAEKAPAARKPRGQAQRDAALIASLRDGRPAGEVLRFARPPGAAATRASLELIAAGANVNAEQDGASALHYACGSDAIGVAPALIAAGADVFKLADDGQTPLEWALHRRAEQPALAALAAMVQDKAAWSAAMAKGASVGSSFVWLAANRGLGRVVEALLDAGDDAGRVHQENGENALFGAITWPFTGESWLRRLVAAVDLSRADAKQETALDHATRQRNWSAWLILREAGAPGTLGGVDTCAALAERGIDHRLTRMAAWKIVLGEMPAGPERDELAAWAVATVLSESWQDAGLIAPIASELSCRLALAEAAGHPPRMEHAQPFADRLAQLRAERG